MWEDFFKKYLNSLITILGILVTGIFWIHTMDGIPKRVDKLEKDVEILKNQMSKNDMKTDLILEDVKYIKVHLLHTKD